MVYFNGKLLFFDKVFVIVVYIDVCFVGVGGYWGFSWFYFNWEVDCLDVLNLYINE